MAAPTPPTPQPPKKREAKHGFTLLKASGKSVSYEGVSYAVVDGVVEVPTESVAVFIDLGLTTLE